MTLREARIEFSKCLAKLINHAEVLGFELAVGEVLRPPRVAELYAREGKGILNSVHTKGLAADVAIYQARRYLTSSEAYRPLGEFWESLHSLARWGGRFGDGNHFSFEWEGVK